MKIIIISIILAISPLIVLTSVACEDCIYNLDVTDKNSVVACLITVVAGFVIRAIEKRRLRKSKEEAEKQDNSHLE